MQNQLFTQGLKFTNDEKSEVVHEVMRKSNYNIKIFTLVIVFNKCESDFSRFIFNLPKKPSRIFLILQYVVKNATEYVHNTYRLQNM